MALRAVRSHFRGTEQTVQGLVDTQGLVDAVHREGMIRRNLESDAVSISGNRFGASPYTLFMLVKRKAA